MLDVLSIKYNNIPMVVFKTIALDLLVIRHCRVNCIFVLRLLDFVCVDELRNASSNAVFASFDGTVWVNKVII